jgi:hypothetical protein
MMALYRKARGVIAVVYALGAGRIYLDHQASTAPQKILPSARLTARMHGDH